MDGGASEALRLEGRQSVFARRTIGFFFLSLDFALYLSFFCILDSFVAANDRIEAGKKR